LTFAQKSTSPIVISENIDFQHSYTLFSDGFAVKLFDAMNMLQMYMPDFYRQDLSKRVVRTSLHRMNVEVLDSNSERVFIELRIPKPSPNVQYDFSVGVKPADKTKLR